jgi:hypothetical protein
MYNTKRKIIFLLIVFLTVISCDKGQPNHFGEMLIDYDERYNKENFNIYLESSEEKSKIRIEKLVNVEDITNDFLKILEEWKFIYSALLVLKSSNDELSLAYKGKLLLNAKVLGMHWDRLMKLSKSRYRTCDSWWIESNIDNFKEVLYNQRAFQIKALDFIESLGYDYLQNYYIQFDDIDCMNGLSDIEMKKFIERFENDNWTTNTKF